MFVLMARPASLSEDERRKVITLLFSENVSVTACATRFSVGRDVILRLRRDHVRTLDSRKQQQSESVAR